MARERIRHEAGICGHVCTDSYRQMWVSLAMLWTSQVSIRWMWFYCARSASISVDFCDYLLRSNLDLTNLSAQSTFQTYLKNAKIKTILYFWIIQNSAIFYNSTITPFAVDERKAFHWFPPNNWNIAERSYTVVFQIKLIIFKSGSNELLA